MDEKSINRLKAVPRIEPDYTHCRAVVISAGIDLARQCARHPVDVRLHRDGQRYRVCRQHKQAQVFIPWTSEFLMSQEDLARSGMRKLLAHQGYEPPRAKLVDC